MTSRTGLLITVGRYVELIAAPHGGSLYNLYVDVIDNEFVLTGPTVTMIF